MRGRSSVYSLEVVLSSYNTRTPNTVPAPVDKPRATRDAAAPHPALMSLGSADVDQLLEAVPDALVGVDQTAV